MQEQEFEARDDAALSWLLAWSDGQNRSAAIHYFHIISGIEQECACPFQGETS